MNTRVYLTKIHTHLQDHNTYKLLTHNPTNAIGHDDRTLIHYMHSKYIIDTATMEFLPPLGIHKHLSSMGYQKYTSQTVFSALLCQDVMVQLTVSYPILPTSSTSS